MSKVYSNDLVIVEEVSCLFGSTVIDTHNVQNLAAMIPNDDLSPHL